MKRLKHFLLHKYDWLNLLKDIPGMKTDIYFLLATTGFLNLLGLALPIVMMQIFDRVIPYASLQTLSWLIIGVIISVVFETLLRTLRGFISSWIASRFEHMVGTGVVNSILNLRLDEYEKDGAGVHLERLNSIATLRTFYSGQLFQILLDVPFAILYVWLLFFIGGSIGLFTVGLLFLFTVLALYVRKQYKHYQSLATTIQDRHINFLVEILSGMHTIKALAMEELMLRRYESLQTSIASANLKTNNWDRLPSALGSIFSNINRLGIIGLGAGAVISNNMTVGAMTACAMVAARVMQPFQQMAGFWLRDAEATIARKHLNEMINIKEMSLTKKEPTVFDIDGKVMLRSICYRPPTHEENIFDNISLSINPGELVYIECNEQSTASSLAQILVGVVKPDSGNISIDEFSLNEWDHSMLKGRVEYVSRFGKLFSGSILENITLFNSRLNHVAQDTATLIKLDEMVADLPQGYETNIMANSNTSLSHSFVQRICLARSLTIRPRVIILDQILLSLDSESREIFYSLILELTGECTIIVIGNENEFELSPDRKFVFEDKDLVEQNTVKIDININSEAFNQKHWDNWVISTGSRLSDLTSIIPECYIDTVNQDHRQFASDMIDLTDLLNKMQKEGPNMQDLQIQWNILDSLFEYMTIHLKKEESLIEEMQLPYLDEQKKEHSYFLKNLENYITGFKSGRLNFNQEFIHEIMHWFFEHMHELDSKTFQVENFTVVLEKVNTPEQILSLLKPCGLQFLDNYHIALVRKLFVLFQNLDTNKNNKEEINTLFENLASFAKNHFAEEEKYIQKYDLKNPYIQKGFHTVFLSMIISHQNLFNLERLPPGQIKVAFLSWLLKHVNEIDYHQFSFATLLPIRLEAFKDTKDLVSLLRKTGVSSIDKGHIHFINTLFSKSPKENLSQEEILAFTETIKNLAKEHFSMEEQIMDSLAISNSQSHKSEHKQLIHAITSYMDDLQNERTQFTKQLQNRIAKWWIQHVNESDYRSFVTSLNKDPWSILEQTEAPHV